MVVVVAMSDDSVRYYKRFIPKLLRYLITNDIKSSSSSSSDDVPMVSMSYRIFGSLLFADISGFTKLSVDLNNSDDLKTHIK